MWLVRGVVWLVTQAVAVLIWWCGVVVQAPELGLAPVEM